MKRGEAPELPLTREEPMNQVGSKFSVVMSIGGKSEFLWCLVVQTCGLSVRRCRLQGLLVIKCSRLDMIVAMRGLSKGIHRSAYFVLRMFTALRVRGKYVGGPSLIII